MKDFQLFLLLSTFNLLVEKKIASNREKTTNVNSSFRCISAEGNNTFHNTRTQYTYTFKCTNKQTLFTLKVSHQHEISLVSSRYMHNKCLKMTFIMMYMSFVVLSFNIHKKIQQNRRKRIITQCDVLCEDKQ